jgi:hypothetical protein
MLTGKLPCSVTDPEELARMHREVLPPSPRSFNPAIPPVLEQILLKVLSKEPSARYRTADQFGRVLENFLIQGSAATQASVLAPKVHQPRTYEPRNVPVTQNKTNAEEIAGNPLSIDWITIGLGLLALVAVGGLIPFWLWVYFVYNPPIR